jgi:hypothetical protein
MNPLHTSLIELIRIFLQHISPYIFPATHPTILFSRMLVLIITKLPSLAISGVDWVARSRGGCTGLQQYAPGSSLSAEFACVSIVP